jgi:hypothetical protein
MAALLPLGSSSPAPAWGGKVNLVRRYRPGEEGKLRIHSPPSSKQIEEHRPDWLARNVPRNRD